MRAWFSLCMRVSTNIIDASSFPPSVTVSVLSHEKRIATVVVCWPYTTQNKVAADINASNNTANYFGACGFGGHMNFPDLDFVIDILTASLGNLLREKMGATYSVAGREIPLSTEYSMVVIDFSCDNKDVVELATVAYEHLIALYTQGPPLELIRSQILHMNKAKLVDLSQFATKTYVDALMGTFREMEPPTGSNVHTKRLLQKWHELGEIMNLSDSLLDPKLDAKTASQLYLSRELFRTFLRLKPQKMFDLNGKTTDETTTTSMKMILLTSTSEPTSAPTQESVQRLNNAMQQHCSHRQPAFCMRAQYIQNEYKHRFDSVYNYLLNAGSTMLTKTIEAPLLCLKLQLQNNNQHLGDNKLSVLGMVHAMYSNNGLGPFFAGNTWTAVRYVPYQMINLVVKKKLHNSIVKPIIGRSVFASFASDVISIVTGSVSLVFLYPLDLWRVLAVAAPDRSIPWAGMYVGFGASICGLIVYRIMNTTMYRLCRDKNDRKSFLRSLSWTLAAGFIAYPFDTIRCRQMINADLSMKDAVCENTLMSLWDGAMVNVLGGLVHGYLVHRYHSHFSGVIRSFFVWGGDLQ